MTYNKIKVLTNCRVKMTNVFDNDTDIISFIPGETFDGLIHRDARGRYFVTLPDGWGGEILENSMEELS